jgi:peptide/nickel transport system ATP-binding protein
MTEHFIVQSLKISVASKELVNISFEVDKSLAIVGQSGSGKTLTLKTILGLPPQNLHIDYNVQSSFTQNSKNISYVPQNPFTSLSPLTKIKKQFFTSIEKQLELLEKVNLDSSILERFPSELSGGQLQRIVIAIALSSNPKLILLDEPTTALDSTSKKHIIELLNTLQQEYHFKIIFVTHDINSIESLCENIIILENGLIVESGKSEKVLQNPKHAYTKKLINSSFSNKQFRT